MSDIELVIKLDKDIAQGIIDGENDEPRNIVRGFQATIADAIKNGKPLDLEGLKSDMKALNCGFPYGLDYLLDCLDKRLGITIIEADKGSGDNNGKA